MIPSARIHRGFRRVGVVLAVFVILQGGGGIALALVVIAAFLYAAARTFGQSQQVHDAVRRMPAAPAFNDRRQENQPMIHNLGPRPLACHHEIGYAVARWWLRKGKISCRPPGDL